MIKNNTEFIFNDTPTKSNPNMNQKWVKRTDDYSNYAKEYIIHYKKSLKGNSISLSKYPYMKVKWEALGMKLEKAKKKRIIDWRATKKSNENSDKNSQYLL